MLARFSIGGVLSGLLMVLSFRTLGEEATNSMAGSDVTEGPKNQVVLPPAIPDPLEPANRLMFGLNRGIMTGVVKPSSRFYRALLPPPIRISIAHFGRNVLFPGRLLNNLLEGKWAGARDESERFLCNTIAGGAGFFDVATRLKIPKSDADFGLTFECWGWRPDFYLMLPFLGPSNDRDAIGVAGDTLANPLTYFQPYSYVSPGVIYNRLTDSVDAAVRATQSQSDPYSILHYAATFKSDHRPVDFQVRGEQDVPSLQTLGAVNFGVRDPEFPNQGRTRSIRIPATGRSLKFTYWLPSKKAPLVYIVPGLGGHRLDGPVLALAELVFQHGYGVVTVSSVFHPEFMEHASTAALPAYTPIDAHDLLVALTAIDQRMLRYHPDRVGSRALVGYSMGAFHSLFIAAGGAAGSAPLLAFDRYLAIDPPVRLLHGLSRLDACYQAPTEWPATERMDNIRESLRKVAALFPVQKPSTAVPPFSSIESRFLIGGAFRLVLRDAIYSSQRRTNLNVLKHPIKEWNREEIYQEIMDFSYRDYFERLAVPYYKARGIDVIAKEIQNRTMDLRIYSDQLKANSQIRIIANRNDILLEPADVAWLEQTFAASQLKLFDQGGHLGNLAQPDVQQAVVSALDGL